MRVTVENPGNRDASLVLSEDEEGNVHDGLTGELLTRAQVQDALKTCELYVRELKDYLLRTCDAPGVLVQLKRDSFSAPECEGGWSFADEPVSSLAELDGVWVLEVTVRYEHDDDRGGQFEKHQRFFVRDGRLLCDYGSGARTLADVNDFAACETAVAKEFWTDGGY